MGLPFGIDNFLFGESPSQKITPTPLTTEEQNQALQMLLQGLTSGGATQAPQLGGPLYDKILQEASKVGPLTDTARGTASDVLGGKQPTPTAGQLFPQFSAPIMDFWARSGVPGMASATFAREQTAGPSDFLDFFRQTVEKPAMENLEEDMLPAIRSRFAPSGFYSGERLESERTAREDLLDALTRERARTGFEAFESQRNRALDAASTQGSLGVQSQSEGIRGLLGALTGATQEADSMRGLLANAMRSVPGIEGASLGAIPTDLLLGQLQADTGALDSLIRAINLNTFENIVFNNPGSSGAVSDFLQGGGGAVFA